MKLHLFAALVAGTALTQISASPISVMVVTSSEVHSSTTNSDSASPFRFGHAMAPNNVAKISMVMHGAEQKKPGCRGSRFRQKAIELSNSVRKALGFPLIAEDHRPIRVRPFVASKDDEGRVRILPFIGTPNSFVEIKQDGGDRNLYIAHPHPHHKDHHVGFRQRLANRPFIHRLHVALMTLGPWEGRAVAFVLGCGIGVLLRMIWVLAVVTYRVLKGSKSEEHDYTEILFVEEIADPEEIHVHAHADAPPTYTYPDEKADKDKIQENNN